MRSRSYSRASETAGALGYDDLVSRYRETAETSYLRNRKSLIRLCGTSITPLNSRFTFDKLLYFKDTIISTSELDADFIVHKCKDFAIVNGFSSLKLVDIEAELIVKFGQIEGIVAQ